MDDCHGFYILLSYRQTDGLTLVLVKSLSRLKIKTATFSEYFGIRIIDYKEEHRWFCHNCKGFPDFLVS